MSQQQEIDRKGLTSRSFASETYYYTLKNLDSLVSRKEGGFILVATNMVTGDLFEHRFTREITEIQIVEEPRQQYPRVTGRIAKYVRKREDFLKLAEDIEFVQK